MGLKSENPVLQKKSSKKQASNVQQWQCDSGEQESGHSHIMELPDESDQSGTKPCIGQGRILTIWFLSCRHKCPYVC